MGNDQSRPDGRDHLQVVTLPNDIPEEGHAPVAAPATAPAATEPGAANSGNGSLDQLPSVQPKTENAANSAIVRDLGDYRLEKQVLGEGAFGKVRLATSTRTSHRVAVKVIKRKKLNERAEVLLQRERKHHEKVRIPAVANASSLAPTRHSQLLPGALRRSRAPHCARSASRPSAQLRHRNIVRLHTFIMTPNKYYLVMEYCEGGDMLQFINSTTMLSDELARTLFRGLIDGIHFCHVLGIHHRDLKLENLMLTSRDEKTMAIKIADFGLSDLQTLPSSLSSTFCGSPLYAAPELMTAGAAPDGYDASKSDVWSCGVICYALLTSALPFDAEDISTLVRLIQRGVPNSPVPESRGPLASQLVGRMLTVDPKERPLAAEVLQHAWVKEGEPKSIKGSVTTGALPQVSGGGGSAADGGGGAPSEAPPIPQRRRGATATTKFFRDLKEEVLREDDEATAGAPSQQPLQPPAEQPPPPPPPQPPPQQQPPPAQPQPSGQATAPTPPPPMPSNDASGGGGTSTTPTAPPTAPAAPPAQALPEDQKRQPEPGREKGKAMTKGELAAIKLAVANGEVEDPPEPEPEPAPEPEPEEPAVVEPSEPSRKGGAPMTKDEWEAIKQERKAAKEARERGGEVAGEAAVGAEAQVVAGAVAVAGSAPLGDGAAP